jgi:HPt (histidine-containing phosphotransfer) domain-containing protein/HAMP domain-containing protein
VRGISPSGPPATSLRTKLTRSSVATLGLVCLLVLVAVALVSTHTSNRNLAASAAEIESALASKGRLLVANQAIALRGFVADNGFVDIRRVIIQTVGSDDDIVFGAFVDTGGRIWAYADRQAPRGPVIARPKPELLLPALPGPGAGASGRISYQGELVAAFSAPVLVDGDEAGVVRYGLSLASMRDAVAAARAAARRALALTLGFIAAIGAAALAFGWLTARRRAAQITGPITVLSAAALAISRGTAGVQVAIESGDEIEALGACFNKMVRDLEASYAELAAANRTLEDRVQERTAALGAKTRDLQTMLGNLRQGVFTVLPGQVIHHEYSAYLERILETDAIAGRELGPLIFQQSSIGPDARQALSAALDNCLGTDGLNFLLNRHHLPTTFEVTSASAARKVLEAEWNPIEDPDAGTTAAIMATVRDVTELRELQHETERQRQRLAMLAELLALSEDQMAELFDSSGALLGRCRATLAARSPDRPVLDDLFRCLHTIKGNARALGLTQLSDVVHLAESRIDPWRGRPLGDQEAPVVLAELAAVEQALASYRSLVEPRLAARARAVEADARLAEDLEGLAAGTGDAGRLRAGLQAMARRLRSRPLAELLAQPVSGAIRAAAALGKAEPWVEIEGGDLPVPRDLAPTLRDVFVHLLRNAVDHGIERPEERLACGKPARGRIRIAAARRGDTLWLTVDDDGAGLDVAGVLRRARELGMAAPADAPDPVVAGLVFASGLSLATRVSDISGRGVGLDAVRGFVEERGGTVELALLEALGPARRRFQIRLRLPLGDRFAAAIPGGDEQGGGGIYAASAGAAAARSAPIAGGG